MGGYQWRDGHVPRRLGHTTDISGVHNYRPADSGRRDIDVVSAREDPSEDETISADGQYWQEEPTSICYTRYDGIWQTVWLETRQGLFDSFPPVKIW